MKKIFYSFFIISLFAVGVAHAEEGKSGMTQGGLMMGSTTMPLPPHQDGWGSPTMLMMGSGTSPMMGGDRDGRHRERMGTGSLMMMPPIMMGSSSCRKFARGLKLGTQGDDVKELQEMLHEGGFLGASSTGFFGKMTKEAVVKFQKEGGLNPSGFFGELSRKHHQKRCGEGMGHSENKKQEGDDRHPLMGSSTMPVPCMVGASANGCEHSNAFPPCLGMFSTSTGQPCPKPGRKDGDHIVPPVGSTTCAGDCRPSGSICTMIARMCPDGTVMQRDNMCGWHPEKCGVLGSTTPTF